jgi:hypothetical protein
VPRTRPCGLIALAIAIACAAPAIAQETPASDRAWAYEDAHGACSRLRDRLTDSPADVAACDRHTANMPRCWNYRGMAWAWFYTRQHDPQAFGWSGQILDSFGGPKDVYLVDQDPEYRQQLRRLLAVVTTLDQGSWKTTNAFAEEAYRRCLSGNPF